MTGETGHSSGIFGAERGSGAVYEAARILAAFQAELGNEKYLTINPSVIVGGTKAALDDYRGTAEGKTNVIAPIAVARGDIRYISLEQERSARRAHAGDRGAAPAAHAGDAALRRRGLPADGADARQRGPARGPRRREPRPRPRARAALDPAERGAGDIGFIAHLLPCLDGLGSGGGGNSHAPGEYTGLDTLTPMAQRAAVLIYRLTR